MNCPNCAREILYNEKRCPACGTDLTPYYRQGKQLFAAILGCMAGAALPACLLGPSEAVNVRHAWMTIASAAIGGIGCYLVARMIFALRQ
jgi:hypothetical protein